MENRFDILQMPDMPRVVYQSPPLALAICQIRYNNILNVANPGFVAPFQTEIQSLYPQAIASPTQEISLRQVGSAFNELDIVQGSPAIQWQFSDQEDNWKIVLASGYLGIETRVYEHFDVFMDRLRKALEALITHIKPISVLRIGLRYINEIRSPTSNWSDIIRRELLGVSIAPELIGNATQITATQQYQLRYPGNRGININHGPLLSGTTVRPQKGTRLIEQPFYLLDLDVYREFSAPHVTLMDTEFILQEVNEYHRTISQLFYWSVTEKYLSTLEEQ